VDLLFHATNFDKSKEIAMVMKLGAGSPENPQAGSLRYVARASCLRVLAASCRQFQTWRENE
jgi:hypothetical protein